jgi:hypothetical protein
MFLDFFNMMYNYEDRKVSNYSDVIYLEFIGVGFVQIMFVHTLI